MSVMILWLVVIVPLSVGARHVRDSDPETRVNQSDFEHHRIKARLLTSQQQSRVIKQHNMLRAKQRAADMELMRWDDSLASTAQIWADRCAFMYREVKDDVGDNLYAVSGDHLDVTAAVQSWYKERAHYNQSGWLECAAGKTCRHYTQVIWAKSRLVGCAYRRCMPLVDNSSIVYDDGTLFVCNYKPAGNTRRLGRGGAWVELAPFAKGPVCSKCASGAAWCQNGLCNSNCSADDDACTCKVYCYNCPKFFDSVADCRCFCADGWFGTDCSMPCEDSHANCNKTWYYPQSCQVDYVQQLCPVTCRRCKPDPDALLCDPINPEEMMAHLSTASKRCDHVTVTVMTMYVIAVVSISSMHHVMPGQHQY